MKDLRSNTVQGQAESEDSGRQRRFPEQLHRLDRTSAFVGRAAEIEALEQAWEEAKRGSLRVALIGGEPGIGKTRIAARLAERVHAEDGAAVFYGHSDPELTIPVQPIAEAFSEYAKTAPVEEMVELGEDAAPLARISPALRERLAEAAGPTAEDDAVEEPAEHHELFHAASSLLAIAARRGPLLLIVDDLQWADPPTALMLRYLISSPDAPPGMIVVTYRATDLEPASIVASTLADLERKPGVFGLDLQGLSREDSLALAAAVAGRELDDEGAELAELVHAEAGGNPLFVTQLLRNLVEAKTLDDVSGGADLRRRLEAIELPGSVTETVRRRIERLGEAGTETLAAAAVIGSEFDADLVQRVAERDAGEVRDILDSAVSAGIVTAGDGQTFGFAHPLITRVLYETIGAASRGAAHRRAALALEERIAGGVEARAGELARHWVEAAPADRDRAREWTRRAGHAALEQFEAGAAARWFAKALELSGEQRDTDHCDLLIGLGVAQRTSGQAAFRETLLEAARLAEDLGDAGRLIAAALANNRGFASASGAVDSERIAVLELALERVPDADSADSARLLSTLAAELTFSGEWDRRVELSDEALQIARRVGDRRTLSDVLTARFVPIWMPETLPERLENSEENVRIADQVGRPQQQFGAVHWRSVALVQAGRLEQAVDAIDRENRIAQRLGDPTALWIATYDRGNLSLIFGRLEEAERYANEAFQIANDSGQPDALSFFGSQIANVRYEQGRLPELQELLAQVVADNPGIPAFRSVLALAYTEGGMHSEAQRLLELEAASGFSEIPRDVTWLAGHTIYAHVCAALDARQPAEMLYERLSPWADRIVYTGISAWGDGDHALGRLACTLGEHDRAEGHLEASRARVGAIGATAWTVRSSIDLADALLRRGKPPDTVRAVELLETAASDAGRLGLEQLRTRADNLSAHAQARSVIEDSQGSAGRMQLRHDLSGGGKPAARPVAPPEPGRRGVLLCEGDTWSISHPGGSIRLRNSKGVRYLAALLTHPGVERHAVDLQGGIAAEGTVVSLGATEDLAVRPAGTGDAGPALDEPAKRAYRERIEELYEQVEEAEKFNDPERASRAREELEHIGRELSAAVGIGGRDRRAASGAERARVNVTRALRKTIQRIADLDHKLGEHLERSVRTGSFCVYEPAGSEAVAWTVEETASR